MSYIEVNQLTHIYNKGMPTQKTAINNISFNIEKGEVIGIVGHTGSGKSTLIQHFNGLLSPTSGSVFIDGQDIYKDKTKLRQIRFKVGMVFQYPEYQLFEETVFKDIAFGPKNMGLNNKEIKERSLYAAKFVGLKESELHKSPFELSGGQKRRAAIAGVLSMLPDILVLDEPAAGLDPIGKKMILSQIQNYKKDRNATIILISHSMEDIAKYADKVLVLKNGEKFCYDTMPNVFKRVDDMKKIGLNIPQITSIMMGIAKKIKYINGYVYNVEDAKKEILSYIRGNKNV